MSDDIFYESMRQGIANSAFLNLFVVCFIFIFLRADTSLFLRIKEKESVLSL